MNAPFFRPQQIHLDSLEVFQLRCWARAALWQASEFSLAEAVDTLQDFAVDSGLTGRIGVDEVQRLMANAFAKVRP
jgi:hypothetical protein